MDFDKRLSLCEDRRNSSKSNRFYHGACRCLKDFLSRLKKKIKFFLVPIINYIDDGTLSRKLCAVITNVVPIRII